jgi:hypothetical protein
MMVTDGSFTAGKETGSLNEILTVFKRKDLQGPELFFHHPLAGHHGIAPAQVPFLLISLPSDFKRRLITASR